MVLPQAWMTAAHYRFRRSHQPTTIFHLPSVAGRVFPRGAGDSSMGISCSRDHSRSPSSARPRRKLQMGERRSKTTSSSSEARSPPCFRIRRTEDDRSQREAEASPDTQERRRRLSPRGVASRKPTDQFLPSPVVRDYAAVSTQNSQFRKHMEDECVAIPKYRAFPDDPAVSSFFGVYDGHGGDFCAKYAAKYFHQKLAELMQVKYSAKERPSEAESTSNRSNVTSTSSMDNCSDVEADVLSNAEIESCYAEAFSSLDKELEDFDESSESGSTAVTCLIRKYNGRTTFHIANVGDSRAIFCCGGQTSRLSVDHKATNEDEVKRIRALNGIIVNKRVAGSISVTRALGQADEKKFITSAPHIASLEIASDDAFLVLVSDGVTDVFSDEELTEFVAKRLAEGEKSITIGKMLLGEAKEQGSMDNMTAVIICFGE